MSNQLLTSHSGHIDQIGAAVARRLSDGIDDLPHDITERLRAARMRAVANRRIAVEQIVAVAQGVSVNAQGAASLQPDEGLGGWWNRLGLALPLLALVAGLFVITAIQDEMSARELAEVDAELLTDELPPSAYVDPGFAQFVRTNRVNQ